MANTYTVKKGDTLWDIASRELGSGTKWTQLKKWNNLSSTLIVPGQVLKLSASGSSGGSGGSSPSTKTPDPNINVFGPSSVDENQLVATWTWSKGSKTEKYKIEWTYQNGTSSVWFLGKSSEITVDADNEALSRQSTYDIPSGATRVRFRLKPISKTYTTKEQTNVRTLTDLYTGKKITRSDTVEVTKSYFAGKWTSYKYWNKGEIPSAPSTPSVESNGSTLTTTVSYGNVDTKGVTHIQFKIFNVTTGATHTSGKLALTTGTASYEYKGGIDCEYKVCARAYLKRTVDNKTYDVWSEWSNYSSIVRTKPAAPKTIKTIRADSSTQVYLAWSKIETADKYEIEYTEDVRYFDKSSQTNSVETEENVAEYYVSGLESGKEYFFRVRALRGSIKSDWTGVKSVVVGTRPAAPTTWSSSSTAIVSEDVVLYWMHNSQDASKQTSAELKLIGVADEAVIITLANVAVDNDYISYTPKEIADDESEPTYECRLKTGGYAEGASIEWQIRTAGVKMEDDNTPAYSIWSTSRNVDIYTTPTVSITIAETVESFPIYVGAVATPNTDIQSPTGYHISIIAVDGYETVDSIGNYKTVKAGDEVYSEYYNPDALGEAHLELLPSSLSLENGMNYIVKCVASMTSGLTAEAYAEFTVDWVSAVCEPNAEIGINSTALTASIRPYCENVTMAYYRVECADFQKGTQITASAILDALNDGGFAISGAYTTTGEQVYLYLAENVSMTYYTIADGLYYAVQVGSTFAKTETAIDAMYGESVFGGDENATRLRTTTDDLLYVGMNDNDEYVLYCMVENREQVTNVWLSVYRREFDGAFTEIAVDLDGEKFTTVTDPHPALDYARYRIVAADKATGHIEYFDCPPYPVGGIAVVIQWDEDWKSFDAIEDSTPDQPAISGSMLILPYNIDVSDSSKPENTLVEYIGRSHPVSYYGTQLGSTSSWNMVIPKDDADTLYALRKLSRWLGDVYVREPSGSGYWAQITVSFSQKHNDLTIPVSLSITRVEGGA